MRGGADLKRQLEIGDLIRLHRHRWIDFGAESLLGDRQGVVRGVEKGKNRVAVPLGGRRVNVIGFDILQRELRSVDRCPGGVQDGYVEGAGRHVLSPPDGRYCGREKQTAGDDRACNIPGKPIARPECTSLDVRHFPSVFRQRFELTSNQAQQPAKSLHPHILSLMNDLPVLPMIRFWRNLFAT